MDRTTARAGILTVIIMAVLVAGIHLHDSLLVNTPVRWISGPLAHNMRYHGVVWEVVLLVAVTGLLLFGIRETLRLKERPASKPQD